MEGQVKTEYRIVINTSHGTVRRKVKKSLDKAELARAQFLGDRDAGKLSPYYDEAKVWIEKREVGKWERTKD